MKNLNFYIHPLTLIDFTVMYYGSNHFANAISYGLLTAIMTHAALGKTLAQSTHFIFLLPFIFSKHIAGRKAELCGKLVTQVSTELGLKPQTLC